MNALAAPSPLTTNGFVVYIYILRPPESGWRRRALYFPILPVIDTGGVSLGKLCSAFPLRCVLSAANLLMPLVGRDLDEETNKVLGKPRSTDPIANAPPQALMNQQVKPASRRGCQNFFFFPACLAWPRPFLVRDWSQEGRR